MATLARALPPNRDDFDAKGGAGDFEFAPGDLMGVAPKPRRSRWGQRLSMIVLFGLGGALHWYAPDVLPEVAATGSALIRSALEKPATAQSVDLPKLSLIELKSFSPPPLSTAILQNPIEPTVSVADTPVAAPAISLDAPDRVRLAAPPASAVMTGALAPASEPAAVIEPPPPPAYVDPLQKRAERIGLHPDLSPAILRGLSDLDFRNAETAIRTAIAETGETAVYLSPKPARDTFARFKVHFVTGAEAGCRRYVVTIIKRGWEATALPMERCRVKRAGLAPR